MTAASLLRLEPEVLVAELNLGADARSPLPHQLAAIKHLARNPRTMLADDMGLGKSFCAIYAARGKTSVICPASLKLNWREEIVKACPSAQTVILNGKLSRPIPDGVRFVICNYEILPYHEAALAAFMAEAIIFDEAHALRSRGGSRWQAAVRLARAAPRRFLLSGTVLVNRPFDLIAPLDLLGKLDDFGGLKTFAERYCAPRMTPFGMNYSGAANLAELKDRLETRGVMFRRRKADVLKLPVQRRCS